ncbi:uncharacterized protein LOC123452309 [Hordeum vulgare subsp. vulgare]|uniref:Neprosin PEP catalytic domain-containing protein n=1 Tax=Hordeum vulgare subsp. vulgare TaxID=112509 RepID=A0A8I6XWL1_HORVV|nr:uncharacterized protein LOC123452309 [Hordeum vulgare subsp. vulgare]
MSLLSLSLALFVVSRLLPTCIHGLHVEPNDIIKTIESECGDIIDCVDIYKQPSLKNPLLRDHKIQFKPTKEPPKIVHKLKGRNYSLPEQTWRRSGSCPEGTIPIRRKPIAIDDDVANRSLRFFSYVHPTDESVQDEGNGKVEIAAAYAVNGPYHGASAAIPIWKVQVEPNEFSKNYLRIASPHERQFVPIPGTDPPDIKNQIAVGMAVYPSVLGDDNPRLYIYATNDGGVNSHCLNHDCGFIQTNKQFALGTKFRDSESKVGGDLYFVSVALYRQTGPAVWWLSINEVAIGYFDSSFFPMPFIESFHNQMGGRVLDTRPGGRHTMTRMGSGMYGSAGANNAASIAYYLGINNDGGDQVDDPVNNIVTNHKCYDVKDLGPDLHHPGNDVAYGGPGGYYCDQ